MKKIIILLLTIVLVILISFTYQYHDRQASMAEIMKNNKTYESFYNEPVLGTDIISVINKATDSNEKNSIEKDENGNYIENDENSIKIDIKFKELDMPISMERINEVGMKQFWQNFGTFQFQCTKIEYHSKNHSVKYIFFEQI